mmetsp:Transcript_15485/g.18877  ORF Transcript_15485/g.18877 Transcript_15485/m.18877 type:complete len:108 (+) Transcript_15485:333-656(+)
MSCSEVLCTRLDCQEVAAWKQGHKHKCEVLKRKKSVFLKSFEVIDDASNSVYADRLKRHGITLGNLLDDRVLDISYSTDSPCESTDCEIVFGDPSMIAFYKNLVRAS